MAVPFKSQLDAIKKRIKRKPKEFNIIPRDIPVPKKRFTFRDLEKKHHNGFFIKGEGFYEPDKNRPGTGRFFEEKDFLEKERRRKKKQIRFD